MVHRTVSLALLPMILATLAGCTAPSMVQPNVAAVPAAITVPAAIIFGTCPQKPVYPEAARREKRDGNVALAFHVNADNTLLDAKVTHSSGHADLDEAARIGLAKCQFRAPTQDGNPVPGWVPVKYRWVL